jgi:hypothetical protein
MAVNNSASTAGKSLSGSGPPFQLTMKQNITGVPKWPFRVSCQHAPEKSAVETHPTVRGSYAEQSMLRHRLRSRMN